MSKKSLEVSGLIAESGTRNFGMIRVTEFATGMPLEIPIILVNGSKNGPTLLLSACIHGNEIVGTEICRRIVMEEAVPKELAGAVIALPICNVPAFLARSHSFGVEMYPGPTDLYQCFPQGGPPSDGLLTERIAYKICTEVASKADYAVDFHQGAAGARMIPYVTVPYAKVSPEQRKKTENMARAAGMKIIYIIPAEGEAEEFWRKHKIRSLDYRFGWQEYLVRNGVVTIQLEIGEALTAPQEDVEIGVKAIKNIMKHLKMIKGEPEIPAGQIIVRKRDAVRNNRGGLQFTKVKLGDFVSKGDILAEIRSPFETVEVVKSPFDGVVMRILSLTTVYPGDRLVEIGLEK